MWLTGRLAPDFKTIADFRRDKGTGISERLPAFHDGALREQMCRMDVPYGPFL
jgi:hypothetical protein